MGSKDGKGGGSMDSADVSSVSRCVVPPNVQRDEEAAPDGSSAHEND